MKPLKIFPDLKLCIESNIISLGEKLLRSFLINCSLVYRI